MQSHESVLFITLDSCRYDTFYNGIAPNIKAVGPLHKATSPSYFTYGSHSAMFVGFTPGIAELAQPLLNPKFAKIFKLVGNAHPGKGGEGFELIGHDIIDGFRRKGYTTIGTASMGWFDPSTPTGLHLSRNFEHYLYTGAHSVRRQVSFVLEQLSASKGDTFTFINVGETHVPYWHEGADWSPNDNPCQPFQTENRYTECQDRQKACLEFADYHLGQVINRHMNSTIVICSDHGDCWGEDGLWEHGIAHEMTTTVPLIIRYRGSPIYQNSMPSKTKSITNIFNLSFLRKK